MPRKKGSKNKKVTRKDIKSIAKSDGFKGGEREKDFAIKGEYKLAVKCLGRKFASEAETFEEAIDKIKIPNGANASSVLTLEKGNTRKTKILNGRHTNGLFGQGSPSLKAIHLRRIKEMLGV